MKTKKTILNFITDVIPLMIIMLLGLYKSKLLIGELATNYVGLYQLFSQLLGYVTIFESGLTGALTYRFFEPVNKKNQNRINIIFSSGRVVFNVVCLGMFILGIFISLLIPFLIKDNPFSLGYIVVAFIMYISTNIIYYLVVSHKVLLEAQEKKHITNIIIEIFDIIKSIFEIVTLILFKNLIILLSVGIITTILSAFCIVIFCKKNNPNLKIVKTRDYSMLKDVKSLFVHKIAYLVNNNIDLILVTKVMGLASVVVYSSYNFVINSLKKIMTKIYTSIVPSLGNLLVENKEKAKNVFFEINDFIFFLATLVCTSLLVVINPFIDIWYSGEIKTTILLSIGFTLVLFVSIVIQPLLAFTDASGIFKETKKCAVLEATINLFLSLILIKPLGFFGILIATCMGYIISDNILRGEIICNNVLKISSKQYYLDIILFYLIFLVLSGLELTALMNFTYDNIFNWFIVSIIIFTINFIILFIIYKVLNKISFIKRLKKVIKK